MKIEEAIRKKPELRVIIGGRTAEVIIREFAAVLDTVLTPPCEDSDNKPIRYEAAANMHAFAR